jgi:multimeric flavodoxin WrbA
MKVLLINGSPRKDGDTAYSLGIVEKVLNGANIETEWFHLGTDKVRGCCDCNQCSATSRCAFSDDRCNELIEQIIEADGVIVGTPVYFAGANGALCALLDRVFYAASNYWNLKLNGEDRFGEKILKILGENMIRELGLVEAAQNQ